MKQITIRGRWSGGIKALVAGMLLFVMLILIIGALIRFTPLPERWMMYAVIGALSLACLLTGMLAGKRIGKKGLLFGILFSVLLILLAVGLGMLLGLLTGQGIASEGLLRILYLPCVLCGAAGGLAGVNMRAA